MNYELAKQLKEAGFPQGDMGGFNFQDNLNYPTLSELIENCGDKFVSLMQTKKRWIATYSQEGFTPTSENDESVTGSTPEIAVARLWLELNKK